MQWLGVVVLMVGIIIGGGMLLTPTIDRSRAAVLATLAGLYVAGAAYLFLTDWPNAPTATAAIWGMILSAFGIPIKLYRRREKTAAVIACIPLIALAIASYLQSNSFVLVAKEIFLATLIVTVVTAAIVSLFYSRTKNRQRTL